MSLYLYEKFLEYIGHEWYGEGDDEDAAKAVLDARIRSAEAAERAIEAWLTYCDSDDMDGTWNAFVSAATEYKAAREAVQRLEGQVDGS